MENLNNYKDAYHEQFKFFDENQWYLKMYSTLMCQRIKESGYKSVLSLGLGHNVVSTALANMLDSELSSYHIVEGSSEIIEKYERDNPRTKVMLFESYFEVFQSKTQYDAIEMGFVLEHVDNPGFVINHFKSFLKPNGTMFISVPNAKSLHRIIGHKAGLLKDIYKLSEYDLQLGHKRYFDLNSITDLVIKNGLIITEQKGLMLKPITGDQINKLNWNDKIIKALMEIGLDYPEISNCIYLEAKAK